MVAEVFVPVVRAEVLVWRGLNFVKKFGRYVETEVCEVRD
jgi:hypothetical protein